MPARARANDEVLVREIEHSIRSGTSIDTLLQTDERVLARVTDGIYRQPWSALRELVANSYDADANTVSISTDAPRFDSIKVADDGMGMGPEALVNLLHHIGGSAKRTQRGPKIGVTQETDATRSPRGRRLIGKIGIGLFSVAQLARQFTIITKTAGTGYQLLAYVTLHRPDEAAELSSIDESGAHTFDAGRVRIWAEKTPNRKGHGTTIHLLKLLPRVVHILQSRDVWSALDDQAASGGRGRRLPPQFHIGRIDPEHPGQLSLPAVLPWKDRTADRNKFTQLVSGALTAWQKDNLYARLEHALDNYFHMLWMLALSLPLDYVESHPFELTGKNIPHWYDLPESRGTSQPVHLDLSPKTTIGSKLSLGKTDEPDADFSVAIDGVQLFRPIRFRDYPTTTQALQGPVMFVGKAKPDLSKIPEDQRGGSLSFTGYFFWTPRLVPQEHNGLLVRINGASGTLFDRTFLKYQVGERRLEHVMAEVFVNEGLEGALNIDRESFNTAHPHYQILANWVHNSLGLIRNKLKTLQSEALESRRQTAKKTSEKAFSAIVNQLILDVTDCDPSEVPEVVLVDDEQLAEVKAAAGNIAYVRNDIVQSVATADKSIDWVETRACGLARFLDAFGLLDRLDRAEQAQLIAAILRICTNNS